MIVKKAGSILLDLVNKKVGIVYRTEKDDYSFAKGHWEEGETLKECAIRETEEETCRKVQIIHDKEVVHRYTTSSGKDVECYYYLTADMGPIDKAIANELKEELIWLSPKEVVEKLSYDNLRDIWDEFEAIIIDIFEKN